MSWFEYTGPTIRVMDIIDPSFRGKPCPYKPRLGTARHEDSVTCQDCGQPEPVGDGKWQWDIGDGRFCHQCGEIYISFDKMRW
jgi:hypothetical protein